MIGLCLGFILGRSLLSFGYPIMLGRVFEVPFFSQLAGIVRPALVTIGLFVLATWLSVRIDVNNWPSLAAYGAASSALVGMTAFLAGLSGDRRIAVTSRIRQFVGGKGGG